MKKFSVIKPLTESEKKRVETRIRSLIIRLKHMKADIEVQGELKDLIERSGFDVDQLLSEIYSSNYAPVKVSDPEFKGKGECDMTSIYLDYSSGFDEFIDFIKDEYSRLIRTSSAAVTLYSNVISLPNTYAKVLLLTFYYEESVESITKMLFISRASYYRYKNEAITLLAYKELGIRYREIDNCNL
jgi:DNA-directed RNA polymerase specialized sigma subunit